MKRLLVTAFLCVTLFTPCYSGGKRVRAAHRPPPGISTGSLHCSWETRRSNVTRTLYPSGSYIKYEFSGTEGTSRRRPVSLTLYNKDHREVYREYMKSLIVTFVLPATDIDTPLGRSLEQAVLMCSGAPASGTESDWFKLQVGFKQPIRVRVRDRGCDVNFDFRQASERNNIRSFGVGH